MTTPSDADLVRKLITRTLLSLAFVGLLVALAEAHQPHVALAGVFGLLVALENGYAGPVVRIQKERGHKVVTTGPYAYVRHPMYAAALLFVFGAPLPLGS